MIDRHEHLFRIYGSVMPRSLLWACLASLEGALLDASGWQLFTYRTGPSGSPALELWHHPYTVNVVGMVIGYVLVMRVQVAYQRFWEGVTTIMQCSSKMGDGVLQLLTFDEVRKGGGPPVFDEKAFAFRMQIIHLCSLFHAVALLDCRGDDEFVQSQLTLNREDPYLFRLHPTEDQHLHVSPDGRETDLRVVGQRVPRVPMQKIIAARRAMSAAAGLEVDEDGKPSAKGQGSDTSCFNCISAVESMEMGVQPVSVRQSLQRELTRRASTALARSRKLRSGQGLVHCGDDDSVHRGRNFCSASDDDSVHRGRNFCAANQDDSVHRGHKFCSASDDDSVHRGHNFCTLTGSPGACRSGGSGVAITIDGGGDLAGGGDQGLPETSGDRKRKKVITTPKREIGTSACEYFFATILLRPSKLALDKLARSNCFDVVGGVTDVEVGRLRAVPADERPFMVMTWVYRVIAARLGDGGLGIPTPLLSRTYEVLSASTAAATQAHKLSATPFPFPLRQLLGLLLLVFQIIVPMVLAAFVDSPPLVAVLCFFVMLGYWSLNETAIELEHPFGLGANHLPVVAYQSSFNAKLARALDVTVPKMGYTTEGVSVRKVSARYASTPPRGAGSHAA